MERYHWVYSRIERRLSSLLPLLSFFRGQRCRRHFSYIYVRGGFGCWVGARMFAPPLNLRRLGWTVFRLGTAAEEIPRISSWTSCNRGEAGFKHVDKRCAKYDGMDGHCIVGWLNAIQERQIAHRQLKSLKMGVTTVAGRTEAVAAIEAFTLAEIEKIKRSCKPI